MKKIIRIQAKCDAFEIDEQIEESKCEKRLKKLRKLFEHNRKGTLVVHTCVVNPKLF